MINFYNFFFALIFLDFRESLENAKINKILEERKTIDEISFKKAGIGPLKKTFKQDPTRIENN